MERVDIVSTRHSDIGEGPHWDSRLQRLIYVDITSGIVSRLNPRTREEDTIRLDGDVSLAVPFATSSDDLIVSHNKQLCQLNWSTRETSLFAEVELDQETRFNDGKCDSRGRLWAGTMFNATVSGTFKEGLGSLYTFSNNTIKSHLSNLSISNGIAWTRDDTKMFFIDSIPRTIKVFDFDAEDGSLRNEKTVVDFNKNPWYSDCGLPDGMTVDINNNLWVACYSGSRVIQIDPTTGAILKILQLPATKITSCCFGGPDYDVLYVTSASQGLTIEEKLVQPAAGAVFEVTALGTRGMPPNNFQI